MFPTDFRAFLEEHYTSCEACSTPLKDIRNHYKRWAEENNKSKFGSSSYKKIIKEKYDIGHDYVVRMSLKTNIKQAPVVSCPNCKDPSLPTHKVCSCSYTCGECEPDKRYMVRNPDVCMRHPDLYPKQETIPTLDEALERGAKIARLKLELMDTEHVRHYLIKQSLEYFDRSEKIIDQLRALKADPSQ